MSSNMSGHVVKLNDDEEDEDEDDTGLLSSRYDDEDSGEDDFHDPRQKSGSRSLKGRLRTSKKNLLPYPTMRSGTVMQLLNTLTICCIFFGMGLTKSLIESPPTANGIQTTEREMATAVGYVLGFLFGGFLLARFSRNFIMLLTLQVLGSMLVTVPWIASDWATDTVYIIIGVSLAILMIGGNVICLDFWGRKSGPYIQALHFCLSLGLLTGPLLVDPLSQTRVPTIVQKALPFAMSANSVAGRDHIIQKRQVLESSSSDLESSTLDPLLMNIFGVEQTTTEKSVKKKPKPAFNDGQKLDNSRDWEKVKVAKPPPEEVLVTSEATTITTTLAPKETTTNTNSMIKAEIKSLQKDIADNEKILTWINKIKRKKRDLGGGFGPPIYNRRLPQPINPNWNPQNAMLPPPQIQRTPYGTNFADYDYDGYGQMQPGLGVLPRQRQQQQPQVPEELPENVEEALGTLSDFLANPKPENKSDTPVKVTDKPKRLTTTLRTTTTATSTTAKRRITTTTTTPKMTIPKRKKPLTSVDDDTDSMEEGTNNVTIKAILGNYGVTKSNIGFILDATYTWIISLILLICMCYRPQRGEPRSRQEADELFGTRATEESRIFKATFTVLLFFFNLLHWGMFVSFSQTLPQFKILASTATYLQRVFVGVFTTTRFLAILTAGLLHPAVGIFISLFIIFVGSLVLVFTQQISAAAVWAGVILQAIGLATLLPTTLVWGEAYVLMSSHVVAMVCWGLALAELMVPYSMKLLFLDTQTWLGMAMIGATILSAGLFTCVFLLARRHGSRFSRPQSSGYELACQDDLNQELLEDDDDFEVAEPSLDLSGTNA